MAFFRNLMLGLAVSMAVSAPAIAETQYTSDRSISAQSTGPWVGSWTGWGEQIDDKWSIDIVFVSAVEARIDYASIPCGGTLYLTDTWGDNAIFREKLTTNVENCIDNGIVTLKLINNAVMHFSWKLDDMTASGSLRRIKIQQ